MQNRRFMIAAPASGSGKTLISCGLLKLLSRKGYQVQSFKCGPDFIDPMFHRHITGRPAGNLDTFMASDDTAKELLLRGTEAADYTLIEGVMGCFDGIAFGNTDGSSCSLAALTDTPVILVVNARGMSTTILPMLQGMLNYPNGHMIKGVILNHISKGIFHAMKEMIERELPIRAVGCLPVLDDIRLDSRHLGLMMPREIEDLDRQLSILADVLEETIDLDVLDALSVTSSGSGMIRPETETVSHAGPADGKPPRIGVADDEAFCFFYAENLRILEEKGAELIRFSPVHDAALPDDLDALLLCGGYPELFAEELAENRTMRESVRNAYDAQMPILAECGGFLYLHRTLEDPEGRKHPMCGVIDTDAFHNHRLTRFGYITLKNGHMFGRDIGEIRAHEFHHYESGDPGNAFCAVKPDGKRKWECIHSTDTLYAGFPHLYYPANPRIADAFLAAAAQYHTQKHINRHLFT